MQVFKVKRIVGSSEPRILVYNEKRTILGEFVIPEDRMKDLFPNQEEVVFVEGYRDPRKVIQLFSSYRIPDPGW